VDSTFLIKNLIALALISVFTFALEKQKLSTDGI